MSNEINNTQRKFVFNTKRMFLHYFLGVLIIIIFISITSSFNHDTNTNNAYETNDLNFMNSLQKICYALEDLKTDSDNQLTHVSVLFLNIGSAEAQYSSTSYFQKNHVLQEALTTLSYNLEKSDDINRLFKKHKFSDLIPFFKNVMKSPLNKKAAEELDYQIIKTTSPN